MSDEKADLRANLARLQEKLAATENVDPEIRTLLESVLRDVDRVVDGDSTPAGDEAESENTLAFRLGEAARHFEEEHPTLAGSLGSVIDALSRMGI